MRGEHIRSEIGDWHPKSHSGQLACDLCKMEIDDSENALAEWYDNYVDRLNNLFPKRPTEEELRKEATKLRSKRKR